MEQLAETKTPILNHFQDYLSKGYYAYGLEFEQELAYVKTLQQGARASLESDLPAVHPTITGASIKRIRHLLASLPVETPVCAAPKGDFLIDGQYTIEVGGPNKDSRQIKDLGTALSIEAGPCSDTSTLPLDRTATEEIDE